MLRYTLLHPPRGPPATNTIPFTIARFSMCTVLFYTATGLAAISDPDDSQYSHPRRPPPPLPKELFVSFRFAETLQYLVDTALAGKAYRYWRIHNFRRIHLN